MASAGIRPLPSGSYRVYWRLDDGSQGGETHKTKPEATAAYNRLKAQWEEGSWTDPRRGRISFDEWATQWWDTWSSDPERSPNSLEATESRLRIHVRPAFGRMQLRAIRPQHVQRWQNELKAKKGHATVMACRSILFRIMRAAEYDGRILTNPVAKVEAPDKPVDVEARFGRAKRRTFTPEEFGRFLAAVPPFFRDHFLTQVGTGLRPSELLGLRVARVDLARGHLEVLEVRYEAGKKYGSGYKNRPKSVASIRPVPMCPQVAKAVTSRVSAADGPAALVFPGPGGGSGVRRGRATGLSTGNLRRTFKAAVADLNAMDDPEHRLTDLTARGPHDFRATYATWLEDAGIPSRVIDELMGHEGGRPERGTSRMGALYRETTPAMMERANAALDERLTVALDAAAHLLHDMDERRKARRRKSGRKKKPQAL